MGSGVLYIYRCSLMLYSAGSGVNSVKVVVPGLSMRLFSLVHMYNCRYSCGFAGVCRSYGNVICVCSEL